MFRLFSFFTILAIFSGCEEDLIKAGKAFERDFGRTECRITVSDLSRYDRGVPVYGKWEPGVVIIDPRALAQSYWFVEFTLFHELGHCQFGLRHVNEPFSIMRNGVEPYWMDDYERNRDRYIDHMRELIEFTRPRKAQLVRALASPWMVRRVVGSNPAVATTIRNGEKWGIVSS